MLESQEWEQLPIILSGHLEQTNGNTNLDELAEQCQKILNTEYSDKLDELYRLEEPVVVQD